MAKRRGKIDQAVFLHWCAIFRWQTHEMSAEGRLASRQPVLQLHWEEKYPVYMFSGTVMAEVRYI